MRNTRRAEIVRKTKKKIDRKKITLHYWTRQTVKLTAEQLLELDERARERWGMTPDERLASADLLIQADIDGLVDLAEDAAEYDFADDIGLPDDMTRLDLEEFLEGGPG